tara:strand:+ start:756 stop:1040 length:285 start_codon:yes stop_codon:yes gene_type:complete
MQQIKNINLKTVIKTSLVTAFTFATALIWKDALLKIIETYVPAQQEIHYILITAFLATVILIALIIIFLQTEREAEYVTHLVINKIKNKKKTKK